MAKIKSNEEWVKEEKQNRKKRLTIVGVIIGLFVLITAAVCIVDAIKEKNGGFYPQIVLDESMGDTELRVASDLDKIVKCPTLPFTFVLGGEIVNEADTYCVFLKDGHYLSICEMPKQAHGADIIKDIVLPGLNGIPTSTKIYQDQEGYFNGRYTLAFCATYEMPNKTKLYTISYRAMLGRDTDVLITGISTSKELDSVHTDLKNILYTLHKTSDIEESAVFVDGISEAVKEETEVAHEFMDEDIAGPGDVAATTDTYYFDIDPNAVYPPNQTSTVEVKKNFESAVFQFIYIYGYWPLDEIKLVSPSGVEYTDVVFDDYDDAIYNFFIENPEMGTWTFVYTQNKPLGDIVARCIDASKYETQEEAEYRRLDAKYN